MPPSTQLSTTCRFTVSSDSASIRNERSAPSIAATATPASSRPAASTAPAMRETAITARVAPQAPANASTGSMSGLRQGQGHEQRHRRAEPRAAGRAEQIGLGQRIAEHALKHRAAQAEQRADQRGSQHARHPPFDQQTAAHAVVAGECAQQFGRRRPVVAGAGRERDAGRKAQREDDPRPHWLERLRVQKLRASRSMPSTVRGPGIRNSARLTA